MVLKQKLCDTIDLLYKNGRAEYNIYCNLLLQCIQSKDFDQTETVETHMEIHSFRPRSTFIHNRLLHLYSKCNKICDARQLFEKMPQRDILSWNVMLSVYTKMGNVNESWYLFNEMPLRDVVTYNTMIDGFVNAGYLIEAFNVFGHMKREGFHPSDYTFVSVLNARSRSWSLKYGKQIHCGIVVSGMKLNVFVWNALIDMYLKCGEIDIAWNLFDRMPYRNVISWNIMIAHYMKNENAEKCLSLFIDMKRAAIQPDLFTFSSVIYAYFQTGKIEEAERTFSLLKARDGVCWTTMIVGFAQNGREEDSFELFVQMLKGDNRPDNFTISSVISTCARLTSLDHGMAIHCLVIVSGFESDLPVSSALVDMYSKCGEIAAARTVFQMMKRRNIITWNSMIVGYAQNGQERDALVLYEKMLQENVKPDNITFVGILSACSHSCMMREGQSYFSSISAMHGMTPTNDHYACMINLLGRSRKIQEALDLIRRMPHEPNALIWSTLLSVCRINGDIENGEVAAEKLLELDPQDAVPYIVLSNMYASRGKWDKVASIRSIMNDKKIRKSAAYSWIEIENKVHKFVSNDKLHPQISEIYKELKILMEKLQRSGFISDSNLDLHDVMENEKVESISHHSEKLALVCGLINKPRETPIRIMKNIRVCSDCHSFMKLASQVTARNIILRDSSRFHHFVGGKCSCKDFW